MGLKPFALGLALSLLQLAAAAADDMARFAIIKQGRIVGHTSFSLKQNGGKVHLIAHGEFNVPQNFADPSGDRMAPVFSGDYRRDSTLDANYGFLTEALTLEVGVQRQTSYIAPSGRSLVIATGAQSTESRSDVLVDLHPNTVVVPQFDVAGIEVLLRMRAKLPADAKMWVVIPNAEFPVEIADTGEGAGSVGGVDVALKCYRIKFAKVVMEAYADPSLNLMYVSVSTERAAYRRDGFKMTKYLHPAKRPAEGR